MGLVILFDPGHGSFKDGVYQTKGKRSPVWPDGRQLFEGEFNRAIVARLHVMCNDAGIESVILVPELEDISLAERVKRANKIFKGNKDAILISIHANAGGGTGFEIFTSVGDTKSDSIAETLIDAYGQSMTELRLRKDDSDGDKDKEAHFYILRKTHCPAVLIESAFMDTLDPDCELLMSENGRDRIANAIFDGIKKL